MPPPVKNPEPVLPKVGSTVEYGKFMYKILTSGSSGGTAAVVKPKKNTDKQIVVPDTIEVKGYVYRVTEISAKAFGKCKKLVTTPTKRQREIIELYQVTI